MQRTLIPNPVFIHNPGSLRHAALLPPVLLILGFLHLGFMHPVACSAQGQAAPDAQAGPVVVKIGEASPPQKLDPPSALPSVSAEVTQVATSATAATVTLAVHNAAPPSRAAVTGTITGTLTGYGPFNGIVTIPGLDTHYTGVATLTIPAGFTLLNVTDGGTLRTDAGGVTTLTYPVTALDGGASFVTGFDVSVAAVPLLSTDPSVSTPIPAVADPATNDTPKTIPSSPGAPK